MSATLVKQIVEATGRKVHHYEHPETGALSWVMHRLDYEQVDGVYFPGSMSCVVRRHRLGGYEWSIEFEGRGISVLESDRTRLKADAIQDGLTALLKHAAPAAATTDVRTVWIK